VWKYILRKLLLTLPLIWCVITLVFILIELSPGDAADKFFMPETPPEVAEMLREKYQLDQPGYVRYAAMLRNLAIFDFGRSISTGKFVFDMILERLPNTLMLASVSLTVLFITGVTVGTLQAVRHGSRLDTATSVASLVLYSMPEFWLAMMLQLLVAFYWSEWIEGLGRDGTISRDLASLLSLPWDDMKDPVQYDFMSSGERFVDRLKHLILPGVLMGAASSGGVARYMRSSLLEVIRQDYIRTARAKGLRERTVIVKHAMRNALLPVVTLMGLSVPALFSGSVLIESIFSWPGMGRLIVESIGAQDTPLLIACFYVFTLIVVAGNLLADIAYAWVDPRIKYD
jgi:peptide/nickel transport system permease protein